MKEEDFNGFGKTKKGKVIHIIKDSKARCDNKIKDIVIDNKLSIKDVTCAKCKRFKDYKEATLASPDDPQRKQPEEEKKEEKKEPKTIGIKTHKKEPEIKPTVKRAEEKVEEKKAEEKVEEKKESEQIPKLESGPAFVIRSITKGKSENICIIHKTTGKVFFDHLDRRVIYDAIKNLNDIPEKWETETEPMPKEFIKKCRKALRKSYEICDIKTPKGLRKSKDGIPKKFKKRKKRRRIKRRVPTKTRSIKRRTKKEPEKRVIKRRTKKENEKRKNTSKKTEKIEKLIYKKVEDGSVFSELTNILETQFGLKTNEAKGMIKNTVLIMSRKLGIPVFIALGKTREDDFYSL